MKKYLFLISFLVINLFSCKAQLNITPLYANGHNLSTPSHNSNNYYKDVNNDLDKFVGTWTYIDGNIEFTIILKKETAVNDNDGDYIYDILVGEYLYKENDITIINTLNDINNPNISVNAHNISGNLIVHKLIYPRCLECNINERRVKLHITNPNNDNTFGWLTIRYLNENGVEKIEVNVKDISMEGRIDVDYGNYVLIKQ